MMKHCKQCILPESYPGIRFNDEGTCNLCLDYEPFAECLGKDKLLELVKSVEKQGQHDCVVPLSGGKDSMYVLYYAARELGLKPLAVTYDAGFQRELARENMRRASEILEVPLITVSSRRNISRRVVRQSLLVSEAFGSFVATCANCETIIRTVASKIARERGIPFVLWGAGSIESKDYTRYREGRSITEFIREKTYQLTSTGMTARDLMRFAPRFVVYCLLNMYERMQMGVPLRYALRPFKVVPFPDDNPKFIHFFDYIPWDSMRDVELLKTELGWQHPKHTDSRFDCALHCFTNYKWLHTRRITADGVSYCQFVRGGKMKREDALSREKHLQSSVSGECGKIVSQLKLKNYKMPFHGQAQDGGRG